MKSLQDILKGVDVLQIIGKQDLLIQDICFDSRKVVAQSVFVAIKGFAVDGHDFLAKVIEQNCKLVVVSELPSAIINDITYVQVADTSVVLGQMAANFYNHPSKSMNVIGVTGTNGKTTVATLLYKLFRELGYNVGLISTVENVINDEVIPSTHTTPDAVSIQTLMRKMKDGSCTHCFMEVSSHAIHQHRIEGISFSGGLFTNISHDHLDYHNTFDEYIAVKKAFFDSLGKDTFSLVNIDDKRGRVMQQNTKSAKHTYALKMMADFKGRIYSNTLEGLELDINGLSVWFRLIGEFNAYNLLLAYGTATLLGEDNGEVLSVLSMLPPANGRFEQYQGPNGMIGIIDYAHTPDALENVLKTISELNSGGGNMITIVGCGGNRDKTKRPKMGSIAAKYSDKVIFTSDNPRDEDPSVIIKEMSDGVAISQKKKTLSILDRREAIKTAVMMANKGDVILLAGKGHETYQEIKGVKHPFDDKKELKGVFKMFE